MLAAYWAELLNMPVRKLKDYLKYCVSFEDFLIRYQLVNYVSEVLKNVGNLDTKQAGVYKEFDRYK